MAQYRSVLSFETKNIRAAAEFDGVLAEIYQEWIDAHPDVTDTGMATYEATPVTPTEEDAAEVFYGKVTEFMNAGINDTPLPEELKGL